MCRTGLTLDLGLIQIPFVPQKPVHVDSSSHSIQMCARKWGAFPMGCTTVKVSEGGSGIVYLVYKDSDQVIIKIRKVESCTQEDFLSEAQIAVMLTQLGLPHLVHCYGTDKTQTCLMFQYQELYQCPDLHHYLEHHHDTKPPNWLDYMRIILFQVLFTLAQLQERLPGFRHNDLKTLNIMLIENNSGVGVSYQDGSTTWHMTAPFHVHIIDFGLTQAPHLSNEAVENGDYDLAGIVDNGSTIYDMHTLFLCILGEDSTIDRFIFRHLPRELFQPSALTPSSVMRLKPELQMSNVTPRQVLKDTFFHPLKSSLSPGRSRHVHHVVAV